MGTIESLTLFLYKQVAAFLFPILFVFTFLQQPALTQVKDPDLPVSPEIEDKSSKGHSLYSCQLSTVSGSISCEIDFPSAGFSAVDTGKIYYWNDISSIRITSWVRHVKGKGYAFYPDTYEVTLKGGAILKLSGNIRELNRFRVIKRTQKSTMYTYYYDEYVKGAWAATGVTDFYSPVLKPAEGCVVSINFR